MMRHALYLALVASLLLPRPAAVAAEAPSAGAGPVGHLDARDLHPVELHRHRDRALRLRRFQPRAVAGRGALRRHHAIRGPNRPIVVRRKERVAGMWMNGPSKTFPSVPGFYAVLSSRPFRAITSGRNPARSSASASPISISARPPTASADEDGFRASRDPADSRSRCCSRSMTTAWPSSAAACSGPASICRSTCRSAATRRQVYLFRDGKLFSQSQSSLQVQQGRLRAHGLSARLPLSACSTGCSRC